VPWERYLDEMVRARYTPHADSHVGSQEQIERFLEDTDPTTVGLCLDTGHVSCHSDVPLPIATRTARYYAELGLT
jgi:sugar phosphate isomerase/epimerase